MTEIPTDVVDWVRLVFAECNARVTEKLARNPNAPEESFDLTWIEQMSRYSSPVALESRWTAKIESHYLGGMRHFRSWEIADIGVLVFLRLGNDERRSKVALLQSKRLYPVGTPVREEVPVDYEIGFARLADPENEALSIGLDVEFNFAEDSRYGALRKGSDQVTAIAGSQTEVGLKVYYQFYNPWLVPFTQRIPLAGYAPPSGTPDLGVRIVPASMVHAKLGTQSGATPKLGDFSDIAPLPPYGWRLEQFVCDELLACREGDQFTSISDSRIQRLFNRRSGPISAAIALTIEAPADTA